MFGSSAIKSTHASALFRQMLVNFRKVAEVVKKSFSHLDINSVLGSYAVCSSCAATWTKILCSVHIQHCCCFIIHLLKMSGGEKNSNKLANTQDLFSRELHESLISWSSL